jgi:mRNA interferase MazF
VNFPFSDLSQTKLRPAIILASASKEDWILCQITSNSHIDDKAIEITDDDFVEAHFVKLVMLGREKIFTGHESLVFRRVAVVTDSKIAEITKKVIEILQQK